MSRRFTARKAASPARPEPLGQTINQLAASEGGYAPESIRLAVMTGRQAVVELTTGRRLVLWPDCDRLRSDEPTREELVAAIDSVLAGFVRLDAHDVAAATTLSVRTVWNLCTSGALPSCRGRWNEFLVTPRNLREFVLARRVPRKKCPARATTWKAAKELRA